jgi:nucleotide-binding universal stress UspA family protein
MPETAMSDDTPDTAPAPEAGPANPITFLVLVDDSDEMRKALRFAALRARAIQGNVALMHVIGPPDFQHFGFIGNKMASEAESEAEKKLQRLAAEVNRLSGRVPVLMIQEGKTTDAISAAVAEDPTISVLVLAAARGKEGPGPLISGLSGSFGAGLRIPVIVIPAHMTDEDIDRLA